MDPRFRIRSDQRTIEIGKTNTGKSYLARHMVAPLPRLIVCDSKEEMSLREWNLQEYTRGRFNSLVRNPSKPGRLRVRVKDEDEWSDYLTRFLDLRNAYIQIDELIQLGDASRGPELRGLFTRGRSRGLGVLACTQRPSRIPLESMSEAEHYIIFQTKLERDNERIYELIGDIGWNELRRYGRHSFADLAEREFLIYSDLTGEAQLYKQLDVKARTSKGAANGN